MTRPRNRRKRPLTVDEYARLIELACRRLAGEHWQVIADAMGWSSKQGAQQWADRALARWRAYQ